MTHLRAPYSVIPALDVDIWGTTADVHKSTGAWRIMRGGLLHSSASD